MELHKTAANAKSGLVLLDQNMRLVQPVNEYLEYQALRGREIGRASCRERV